MIILYNKLKIKNSKRLVQGFSLVETLISILIISLIASVLYLVYWTSVKSLSSSKVQLQYSNLRLNTDILLRKNIESVSIPFWVNEYDYSFDKKSLLLSWVNGVRSPVLVKIPDKVTIENVELILSDEKNPSALKVIYRIDKKTYETISVFSSRKYGEYKL